MPDLRVRRTTSFPDSIRTYRILVDGEVLGNLGPGETIRATVSPGTHRVEAKIDWCWAQPLEVTVDDDTEVAVSSNLQGARLLLGLPMVIFRPGRYLRLELV